MQEKTNLDHVVHMAIALSIQKGEAKLQIMAQSAQNELDAYRAFVAADDALRRIEVLEPIVERGAENIWRSWSRNFDDAVASRDAARVALNEWMPEGGQG